MKTLKFWFAILLFSMAFGFLPNVARADDPIWNGGGKDPNYVPSEQERQASEARKAMAKRYLKARKKELGAEAVNGSKILNIPEVDQLKEKIVWDINANRGLETVLFTKYDDTLVMPGCPTDRVIPHIVAIRGYEETMDRTKIHYIETGQAAQGYFGSFYQNLRLTKFYKFVNAQNGGNNSQVW